MRRHAWPALVAAWTALVGVSAAAEPAATLGLPVLTPATVATPALVVLGRKLFFDRRLSPNGTMSCAMCHVPEQGFTAHELATSVGIAGRSVRRNAPTLLNVAWQKHLFHDGRESSLEAQVWGPLLARNEMDNASPAAVVARIRALPDYRGRFEAAFRGRGPSPAGIGAALAAYQRTLVAGDSRFDRWRYGGDASALTATEQDGYALFVGRARCATCHRVSERDALFTDDGFHNTGIGWARSGGASTRLRVDLTAGVVAELDRATVATFGEPPANDDGRYEVTHDERDRRAYKTPSLRNVALTPPYMHDGSLATLAAVIEHYDRGGSDDPHKSALITAIGLTVTERAALVAFLRTLTSPAAEPLAREARGPLEPELREDRRRRARRQPVDGRAD